MQPRGDARCSLKEPRRLHKRHNGEETRTTMSDMWEMVIIVSLVGRDKFIVGNRKSSGKVRMMGPGCKSGAPLLQERWVLRRFRKPGRFWSTQVRSMAGFSPSKIHRQPTFWRPKFGAGRYTDGTNYTIIMFWGWAP